MSSVAACCVPSRTRHWTTIVASDAARMATVSARIARGRAAGQATVRETASPMEGIVGRPRRSGAAGAPRRDRTVGARLWQPRDLAIDAKRLADHEPLVELAQDQLPRRCAQPQPQRGLA